MGKPLRVGLVGCGFMGRAHSNAYRQVAHFFPPCSIARCSRRSARATRRRSAFAEIWGYASVETDWRRLVERDDIDLVDICVRTICTRRSRWRLPRPAR